MSDIKLSVKEFATLTNQTVQNVNVQIRKGKLNADKGVINHVEASFIDAINLPSHIYVEYMDSLKKTEIEKAEESINWVEIEERFGKVAIEKIEQRQQWVAKAIQMDSKRNRKQLQADLAKEIGVSLRQLYRWISAYEEEGLLGLIPKPIRKHLEATETGVKFWSMDEAALRFIKAKYLQKNRPKVAHVYQMLEKEAKKQGWKIGSRATCYRVIESIAPTEKEFARVGEEHWERTMLYKIRRDSTSLLVNEVWNGDTHTLDFFIEVDGKPVRPQLIAWQDVRSRCIVGYAVTLQGNAYRIGKALRNGIEQVGLPQIAYSDHGKDFDSKYLEEVYERLNIEKRLAKPRWPNSKPIERFFETFTNNYTRYWVGYCGSDAKKNRPEGFDEKKLCEQGKLHDLETALQLIDEAIYDYNTTSHSELKATPLEVMEKEQHARPGKVAARSLDFMFTKSGSTRKVRADGVHFRNHEYWCDELYPLREKQVSVYYDPDDMSQLILYHEGKFVGIAENKRLRFLGANEEDLNAHLQAQQREKKRVKAAIQSYQDQTLEANVAKRKQRGASTLAGNGQQIANQDVVHLTGYEQQVQEIKKRKQQKQQQEAPTKTTNQLAQEYLRDSGKAVWERLQQQGG